MEKSASGQTVATKRSTWNFGFLIYTLVFAFIAQSIFLPCLCMEGTVKMQFAIMLDGLVVLRTFLAWLLKEKNKGWIFYAALLYSSPLWINLIIMVAHKHRKTGRTTAYSRIAHTRRRG